jgi:hypothetical protein
MSAWSYELPSAVYISCCQRCCCCIIAHLCLPAAQAACGYRFVFALFHFFVVQLPALRSLERPVSLLHKVHYLTSDLRNLSGVG